jgi:hypothetical protein
MVDWEITVATIYSDAVDDEVMIMVYKNWSTKCTGYKTYVESLNRETAKTLEKKAKLLSRNLRCEGPLDYRVIEYRDKLIAEEKAIHM